MIAHRQIRVTGLVQGVFFRASARDEARRLGLTGFAQNEPDGTVLIEVEGEEEKVDRFVSWCEHGPPESRVDRMDVTSGAPQGFRGFATR